MTQPDGAAIAAIVAQGKLALGKGDLVNAWMLVSEALDQAPDTVELLYLGAVVRRFSRDLEGAHGLLDRLLAVQPDLGRAHQERGHCLRQAGQRDAAVGAYEKATASNPLLTASWQLLADHYQGIDPAKAKHALDKCREIASQPQALLAALAAYYDQEHVLAEERVRAYLLEAPDQPVAMRLLAELGARLGEYEDSEYILEKCKELNPAYFPARFDLAEVLSKRFRFEQALREAEELVAIEPNNAQFLMQRANLLLQVGETARAVDQYDHLHRIDPGHALVSLTRGHALKTLGRVDDALTAYRHAYSVRPSFGDAYWSLANLKTYRFSAEELAAMIAQEANPSIDVQDRIHFCFALAKAFEDGGDDARSFDFLDRGNRLRRGLSGYDPSVMAKEIEDQIRYCTPALFAAKAGSGCAAIDPIFIVGLPRAGSTLLEQILASHSMVEGTTELPDIMAIAARFNGRQAAGDADHYPANLKDVSPEQFTTLGENYIESTRVHRREAKVRFVDKMPNNFRHIGLIHLILPNARIIDARRNAMACGFSVFKQLFAQGQEFSYDLGHIGRYYCDYVGLMEHWDEVLPGRVLRVRNEDVIDDLDGQVRRILDHVGLPFEQSCVEFHRTARAVRTPSSEQVRRPINRDGTEAWKKFDPWLGPLRQALAVRSELVPND
jgi:tetratricopeptide (TPR) repeat protein